MDVNPISITFRYRVGDNVGETSQVFDDFDCLAADVEDKINRLPGEYVDYEVTSYDDDFADPDDFADLDEYGIYICGIETRGQPYYVFHDHFGEIDFDRFDDDYMGCYTDAEEFVKSFIEEHYTVPDFVMNNVDWDSVVSSFEQDCTFVYDEKQVYVFRG